MEAAETRLRQGGGYEEGRVHRDPDNTPTVGDAHTPQLLVGHLYDMELKLDPQKYKCDDFPKKHMPIVVCILWES